MFLTNLLSAAESAVDSLTSSGAPQNLSFWDKYGMLLLVGGFFVLLILGMVWSSRKRRKQQEHHRNHQHKSLEPSHVVSSLLPSLTVGIFIPFHYIPFYYTCQYSKSE